MLDRSMGYMNGPPTIEIDWNQVWLQSDMLGEEVEINHVDTDSGRGEEGLWTKSELMTSEAADADVDEVMKISEMIREGEEAILELAFDREDKHAELSWEEEEKRSGSTAKKGPSTPDV
jgi:hypothetical protein